MGTTTMYYNVKMGVRRPIYMERTTVQKENQGVACTDAIAAMNFG
jgi:hypothetical protein